MSRIEKYEAEFTSITDLLKKWKQFETQFQNLEMGRDTGANETAGGEPTPSSDEVRQTLIPLFENVMNFKKRCSDIINDVERWFKHIFNEALQNDDGFDGDREVTWSSEQDEKKKETMMKNIKCEKAVYNSDTKEVMCYNDSGTGILSVFGVNEDDTLEPKWEIKWGKNDFLVDICMDGSNTLYGVVRQEQFQKRVEQLDQESLKTIDVLDTKKLLNGDCIMWYLVARKDTVALAVRNTKGSGNKWVSVTIYKEGVRVHTVPLHDVQLQNIKVKGSVYNSSCVLVNENTIILSCGEETKRLAVVSLPKPDSGEEINIKYVTDHGMGRVFSLVWIPSEHAEHGLHGHLWVGEWNNANPSLVHEVDLRKVLEGNIKKLKKGKNISIPENKVCTPFCATDENTIFVTTFNDETTAKGGHPLLLKF